jgi:hypothetical protein
VNRRIKDWHIEKIMMSVEEVDLVYYLLNQGIWNNASVWGTGTYDNGGPQYYRNITYINFVEDYKPCGAVGSLVIIFT